MLLTAASASTTERIKRSAKSGDLEEAEPKWSRMEKMQLNDEKELLGSFCGTKLEITRRKNSFLSVKFTPNGGGGAEQRWGSVRTSHPAAPVLILSIPKNFWRCRDLSSVLLRVVDRGFKCWLNPSSSITQCLACIAKKFASSQCPFSLPENDGTAGWESRALFADDKRELWSALRKRTEIITLTKSNNGFQCL